VQFVLVGNRGSSRSIGLSPNMEHHLLPWFLSMEKLPLRISIQYAYDSRSGV